jgi:hypothetical protein
VGTSGRRRRLLGLAVWPGGARPGLYGAVSKASTLLVRVAIGVLFVTVIAGSRGWTPVRVGALSVAAAAAIAGVLCAGVFLLRGRGQTRR